MDMPDHEFCRACLALACRTVGTWQAAPDAPDDFDTLLRQWTETGRMVVTDRWNASDHPHFTSHEAYIAFRAWHDWLHVTYHGAFDLTGECQMLALHELQLLAYAGPKAQAWRAILHYELIENNFGAEVTCNTLHTN